jgi:hypothetical protein
MTTACGPRVLVHTLADENGTENPVRVYLEYNFLRLRDFSRDYIGDSRCVYRPINVILKFIFLCAKTKSKIGYIPCR